MTAEAVISAKEFENFQFQMDLSNHPPEKAYIHDLWGYLTSFLEEGVESALEYPGNDSEIYELTPGKVQRLW
jgi:hypothetical protein